MSNPTALTPAQRSSLWRERHGATVEAYNAQRRNERAALVAVATRLNFPSVSAAQRQARVELRRNAKVQRDALRAANKQLSEKLHAELSESDAQIFVAAADAIERLADDNILATHIATQDRCQ